MNSNDRGALPAPTWGRLYLETKSARYLNWRINRRVNVEDTELVARVQQGLQSRRFEPGPLSETEVCLRNFARRLRGLIPEARLRRPPTDWCA